MKFLRSKGVTGLLVVVALGVIYWNVIKPQLDRRGVFRSRPAAASKSDAKKTAKTTTASKAGAKGKGTAKAGPKAPPKKVAVTSSRIAGGVMPDQPVDRTTAAEKFAEWVQAPARDPFLLVPPPPEDAYGTNAVSPIAEFRLSGIWHQTGGRYVAISPGLQAKPKVYTEGEMVEGAYKLAKIEDEQVWLMVSNRLERLSLSGPRTNTPAAKRATARKR